MTKSVSPFESLMKDKEVVEALHAEAASRRKFPHVEMLPDGNKSVSHYMEQPSAARWAANAVETYTEAIILAQGRPSLLIQNDTFEQPQLGIWQDRLAQHRDSINATIPSVGRVEVLRNPDFDWLGTAWMIDENILVTNRHVAAEFAGKRGGQFVFLASGLGEMRANVDFREEFQNAQELEIEIEEILFIAERNQSDIAFMRVASNQQLPEPLTMADQDPGEDDLIGVIGYPAFDSRNSLRQMQDIFGDIFNVKRFAPGKVSFSGNQRTFQHDCTTLGGNSGSPVIDLETGRAVGLHFSGRFGVANFAVKISDVKRHLGDLGTTTSVSCGSDGDEDERRMRPSDYEGREGYNEKFLGRQTQLHVPLPELTPGQLDDAVYIEGARGRGLSRYVLDYTHFSVLMCKSRRLAYYTAVNIDGTQEVLLRRRRTPWVFDGRIPERFQAGNDIYRHNDADRGHLVRRLDPVWGADAVAKLADRDTFHYTNAAPQHKNLNQRTWLSLEDHLLRNAARKDLKITVFTGPVFREDDVVYRGLQIPEEFWKVVAMVNPSGDLHATAYLLSQRELIEDFEFVFGRFRTFQTSVQRIERLTDLDFGRLRDFDPMGNAESSARGDLSIPLSRVEDVVL